VALEQGHAAFLSFSRTSCWRPSWLFFSRRSGFLFFPRDPRRLAASARAGLSFLSRGCPLFSPVPMAARRVPSSRLLIEAGPPPSFSVQSGEGKDVTNGIAFEIADCLTCRRLEGAVVREARRKKKQPSLFSSIARGEEEEVRVGGTRERREEGHLFLFFEEGRLRRRSPPPLAEARVRSERISRPMERLAPAPSSVRRKNGSPFGGEGRSTISP